MGYAGQTKRLPPRPWNRSLVIDAWVVIGIDLQTVTANLQTVTWKSLEATMLVFIVGRARTGGRLWGGHFAIRREDGRQRFTAADPTERYPS
jgi:hypothetical protein